MRYGNPSIESRLTALMAEGCDRIIAPMACNIAPRRPRPFSTRWRGCSRRCAGSLRCACAAHHDEPTFAALADDLTRQVRALIFKPEVMLLSFHGCRSRRWKRAIPITATV